MTRVLMVVGRPSSTMSPSVSMPCCRSRWTSCLPGVIGPDHAAETNIAAQGVDIVDHVGGGAQQQVLPGDRDDRDRGFRRYAGHVSPYVMVEHHIADNQDPRPGKTVNDLGKTF